MTEHNNSIRVAVPFQNAPVKSHIELNLIYLIGKITIFFKKTGENIRR